MIRGEVMNKITTKQKEWIDNASYETLLNKWRFAPAGDVMFIDETGDYYSKIMKVKKEKLATSECVAISKSIGWQ